MVDSWDDAELAEQPEWVSSGFGAFESFILNFLVGGGGERGRGGARGWGWGCVEGGGHTGAVAMDMSCSFSATLLLTWHLPSC